MIIWAIFLFFVLFLGLGLYVAIASGNTEDRFTEEREKEKRAATDSQSTTSITTTSTEADRTPEAHEPTDPSLETAEVDAGADADSSFGDFGADAGSGGD